MGRVAAETGKSVSQVALNWVMHRPTVASVIMGARTEEQLRQNLGAVGWRLAPEHVAHLDAASTVPMPYPYWHQASRLTHRSSVNQSDAVTPNIARHWLVPLAEEQISHTASTQVSWTRHRLDGRRDALGAQVKNPERQAQESSEGDVRLDAAGQQRRGSFAAMQATKLAPRTHPPT